jgi:hypothetical protein
MNYPSTVQHWTSLQLEILSGWVDESKEKAKKCSWASSFYYGMYLVMFLPYIILSSIIIQKNDNTSNLGTLILILSTIDRTFNLSKLSASFDEASNRFSAFANDILEEMAKPSRDRRNGTNFLHDMSTEKRRIEEQVHPVPWIIEKIYDRHMARKRSLKKNNASSQPQHSTSNNISIDIPDTPRSYGDVEHAAARVIQRAWFSHILTIKNPSTSIQRIIQRRKLHTFENVVNYISTKIGVGDNEDTTETCSVPHLISNKTASPYNPMKRYQQSRLKLNLGDTNEFASDDQILSVLQGRVSPLRDE